MAINLDPATIKELLEAYRRLEAQPENETKTRFFEYLETITHTTSPKAAYETLTAWLGQAAVTTTTVPTGKLEELEKERLAREEAKKETAVKAKEEVKNFLVQNQERINRAKKLETTLKDKVIYAKVEKPEAPKLNQPEQQVIETLREAAKNNPQQLVADLAEVIKNRIQNQFPPGTSAEEINLLVKQTAFVTVQNLINPEAVNETVILNQIAAVPAKAATPAQEVQEFAAGLALPKIEAYQTSREIISAAFGENLALHLVGPKLISEFIIVLSPQPVAGGQEFKLEQIPQEYSQTQENQNVFVESLKDFDQQEIKSQLLLRTNAWLDSRIAKLPVDSALAKLYSSPKIQATLSFVGLGKPIEWVGTTAFGKIVVGTGFGPAVGWLGKVTGINFGVAEAAAKAAPAVGKALAPAAGKVAAAVAVKTGLSAVFAKIGAALGSFAPIIGNIVGAIVGWVVGKILEKIPWDKVKKAAPYLLGFLVGIPAFILAGPVIGVIAGVGTFALVSGAGLGGIASGLAGFFGAIGSAFVVTIGTPIIITLLVFPVLVALILFIINTGAFFVPPGSHLALIGATNPDVLVTKSANPTKLNNSSAPFTITYTISITALKSSLTNLKIVSTECVIIKKEGGQIDCPKEYKEKIPSLPAGLAVSPTKPYSFSFAVEYPASIQDSLVYDSITISADTPENTGITATGAASVCVGDCAVKCIVVSDNAQKWPGNLRANSEKAVGNLGSKYLKFVARVCQNNQQVNLCYAPSQISPGYYAWHVHKTECDVYFNEKGVGNDSDALFLITHELSHHIQKIDGHAIGEYLDSGAFDELKGKGFCTYQDTAGSETESMAEALGLYASIPSWGSCVTNYKSQYPRNYIFAKNFME